MGPYVELDYEELIQHHINKRCRMTSVTAPDGEALGIFVVDASRRGDAATLFRSGLQKVRDDCERFLAKGYVNPLRSASDFRRLAIDGLLERNAVRPDWPGSETGSLGGRRRTYSSQGSHPGAGVYRRAEQGSRSLSGYSQQRHRTSRRS